MDLPDEIFAIFTKLMRMFREMRASNAKFSFVLRNHGSSRRIFRDLYEINANVSRNARKHKLPQEGHKSGGAANYFLSLLDGETAVCSRKETCR